MSRLGEKIHAVRIQKGMTAKELSRKLGVSEKFILEVEEGRKILNDALIDRISKVFGQNIDDNMLYEQEKNADNTQVKKDIQDIRKTAAEKLKQSQKEKNMQNVKPVWNDALESIIKNVPVYDYTLENVFNMIPLPIVSNKINGYSKDKVLFVEIQDSDMIGFRIAKGDIAFGYITHEIINNSICLVEYNGDRKVRQLKTIGSNQILLISNKNSLVTETISEKEIKILVKLDKLEIKL